MHDDLIRAEIEANALISKMTGTLPSSPEYAEIRAARDKAVEEYAALWRVYAPAIHAAAREREEIVL